MNTSPSNAPPGDPDPSTQEGRLLLVALQVLTQAVDRLPQAINENTKTQVRTNREARQRLQKTLPAVWEGETRAERERRKRGETSARRTGTAPAPRVGRGAAGLLGGLGSLLSAVMRLLGPLGVLASYLGSSASGFQVFNRAMSLFTAVTAPLLLPLFVLLAAALLAVSDELQGPMLDALAAFTRFLFDHGIGAIKSLVQTVKELTDIFGGLIGVLKDGLAGKGAGFGEARPDRPFRSMAGDPDETGKLPVGKPNPNMAGPYGTPRTPEEWKVIQREAQRNWQRRVETKAAFERGQVSREFYDQVIQIEEDFYKNMQGDIDFNRHLLVNPKTTDRLPVFKPGTPFFDLQGMENPRNPAPRPPGAAGGAPAGAPGQAGGGAAPGGRGGFAGRDKVMEALSAVLGSLNMSQGPKANISSLGEARTAAQMSVFRDPIEAKIEQNFAKVIGVLNAQLAEMQKANQRNPIDPGKK